MTVRTFLTALSLAAVAAPALAGLPVTHREVTPGFVVVSGHVGPEDERNAVDWQALADAGLTIVLLMGVATLPAIAERLLACGMPPETPAAVVADAGMPSQRSESRRSAEVDSASRGVTASLSRSMSGA